MPDEHVLHAVVGEVGGDGATAVGRAVGESQTGDFKKLAALDVQKDAVALEAGEALAAGGDQPGIFHPPVVKGFVRFDGRGHDGAAVERL
jgi:hypothetical protein